MAPLSPPEPERVGPPRTDRRWLAVPLLVFAFVLLAVVKPWGDGRTAGDVLASASPLAVVPSGSLAPADTAGPTADTTVIEGMPAAAAPIHSHELESVPWANELAADGGGAWAWSDSGVVRRIGTNDVLTKSDLGRPRNTPGPLGSRGIAVASSQVWASDPIHRGLTRMDVGTASVADRVSLWSVQDEAAAADAAASSRDRFASSSGFAIHGDSIFLPTLAPRPRGVVDPAGTHGALWRIDTKGDDPPTWVSIDHPTGVAAGFGSVWVVSCCGDHSDARTYSIVRLGEETGDVQARIVLPVQNAVADSRPVIRVGPDSVWVGLTDPAVIVRIDPATSSVRSTLPAELPVTDLAIGPDDSLWVTESEPWYRFGAVASDRCDGRLERIDPTTEELVAATTMTCPMSVAVAGDDVWVGTAGTEGSGTSGGVPPQLVHLRAVERPG
ncbi:MAG: hypothetical protein ACJ77Y_03200 [Chloroflexota bacterium]